MKRSFLSFLFILILSVFFFPAYTDACGLGIRGRMQARQQARQSQSTSGGSCQAGCTGVPSTTFMRAADGSLVPCPSGVCSPAAAPQTMQAKVWKVGDHVSHPANASGLFPAGTGVIERIIPWNDGKGSSYQVRCDLTGKMLPVNFSAGELK